MRITDTLEETYAALSGNKVRSGLTVLGIVIGISSVIAMVSIGQGAQSSITSSIQSIGSNLIMITPGAQRGTGTMVSSGRGSAQSLTTDDVDAIEASISDIEAIAPSVSGSYQVTAQGNNTNTSVIGTVSAYMTVRNVEVELGSFLSDQHVKSMSKVAVIGPTTRDDLFGEGVDPTGETIKINKISFKVIGVTTEKGGSGFSSQDDIIYIPLSTAQRFLVGNDYLSTISIAITDTDLMTSAQNDITALLRSEHGLSESDTADFSIMNQSDIVETASSVTQIFTILLGSVAGISLVVGGIGIMNMMLTTVTERTREIGLRKAIGARRKDISTQFIAEAIALTLVGGIIGIALGILISYAITYSGLVTTTVSWSSIALAFGVSAAIGIIFGYYPARRAARLNPIDALRYE